MKAAAEQRQTGTKHTHIARPQERDTERVAHRERQKGLGEGGDRGGSRAGAGRERESLQPNAGDLAGGQQPPAQAVPALSPSSLLLSGGGREGLVCLFCCLASLSLLFQAVSLLLSQTLG